jgi:hypothetical protein
MKSPAPPKSATIAGMTVEVIVASKDVRRLMRERTTIIAQNLGPFWNSVCFFSVLVFWASTQSWSEPRVEAAVSCCAIVRGKMTGDGCKWYDRRISRLQGN